MALLLLGRGGVFILLVMAVAPGLGFGLVLMSSVENIRYPLGGVLFILLSLAINTGCSALVTINFLKSGHYAPFNLIAFSAIGAVLLNLCYDLLLVGRFSLYHTIAMPAILGIGASLIGAACMQIFLSSKPEDPVATLLYLGIFTVFPLWQYLFARNTRNFS
ncbi:hypothetical protein ACQ86N_18575 [Puia sp. P3]|uniref:hypothetical protein n=1 Tax=Puia sp. P3 TaxID=3423952 RepID=UPI003D6743B1